MKHRREILIERMNELEKSGMGCIGCSGTCCTFEANSMLMTPIEAKELFDYLKANDLLTSELKIQLEKNVSQFRLEPKYPTNKRSYLRKTYTCPFFGFKELGCPLPREVKPYGCLAFNSHHMELKATEHCYSEKELLQKREESHPEEKEMNTKIIKDFNLLWEKAPIPNALLEIWNKTTF